MDFYIFLVCSGCYKKTTIVIAQSAGGQAVQDLGVGNLVWTARRSNQSILK